MNNQSQQSRDPMFKCILETPQGEILIGRGPSPDFAFQECLRNLQLVKTPTRGPGMWEGASVNSIDK